MLSSQDSRPRIYAWTAELLDCWSPVERSAHQKTMSSMLRTPAPCRPGTFLLFRRHRFPLGIGDVEEVGLDGLDRGAHRSLAVKMFHSPECRR